MKTNPKSHHLSIPSTTFDNQAFPDDCFDSPKARISIASFETISPTLSPLHRISLMHDSDNQFISTSFSTSLLEEDLVIEKLSPPNSPLQGTSPTSDFKHRSVDACAFTNFFKGTNSQAKPDSVNASSPSNGSEMTSRYDAILSQNPISYEVPGDGSCLFWSILLGHFLPTLNNNELTERKFSQIFKGNFPWSLEEFKRYISSYDGKNLTGNQAIKNYIVMYLRRSAADVMQENAGFYSLFNDTFYNFDEYLNRLKFDFSFWGGNSEIKALSDAFGLSICILSNQHKTVNIFGENRENSNEMLTLHHVPASPDTSQIDNHYCFLTKQPIERPNTNACDSQQVFVENFLVSASDSLENSASCKPLSKECFDLTKILNDFPYPCQAPSNTNFLLWTFIFSVFNDLSNESLTTELFESIFYDNFCEIDEFIYLLQNFNLQDPDQNHLANSIIRHLKDAVEENLMYQSRNLTTCDEKERMNRKIDLFTIGINFDLDLIIDTLSDEFEIPIFYITSNNDLKIFGEKFNKINNPVYFKQLASPGIKGSHNCRFQFLLSKTPENSITMTEKSAYKEVLTHGCTKALEKYPKSPLIERQVMLKMSGIIPNLPQYHKITDASLIDCFISKVGPEKAVAMFPNNLNLIAAAILRNYKIYLELPLERRENELLASTFIFKVGIKEALRYFPNSKTIQAAEQKIPKQTSTSVST